MARRIMLIDLDAFFVSVEQVLNPELKGKPVVVGGKPDRRGVVAAASYEARTFGLRSGMPLATAVRLCPQAIFIEGNFHRYREFSEKFMAILADFSPFLEPAGLDEAYLDATGFESLHGSASMMAKKIKQRVKDELGLPVSIGIASGKVIAKVACEQSKPDGLLETAPGSEGDFLRPLPVGRLPGIGKKSEAVLKGLGITTIGELAKAPVKLLGHYFGSYATVLHEHASGIDESPVTPPGPAKSISRETTFAKDTRDLTFLLATLRYLAEQVGSELRETGKQARCINIKLRYADFTTITRQHTLEQPASADQTIFETGARLLEKELRTEKQRVRLIGTGVSNLVEGSQQTSMLDTRTPRLAKLNATIDRIRERYGFTAIQTGRTFLLKDLFEKDEDGYSLHTPGLSG
ncbi:MAG: DNA polymerase IV [Dehalococcoidales bacterium]|nr:DNA polymerase IV [Dehalococcoidales bacterium]